MKPTIVLVHGSLAESASWDKVIDSLASAGHPLIAAANPLRGPAADVVGHPYGGSVIPNIPADAGQITGLVHVCAFAPH